MTQELSYHLFLTAFELAYGKDRSEVYRAHCPSYHDWTAAYLRNPPIVPVDIRNPRTSPRVPYIEDDFLRGLYNIVNDHHLSDQERRITLQRVLPRHMTEEQFGRVINEVAARRGVNTDYPLLAVWQARHPSSPHNPPVGSGSIVPPAPTPEDSVAAYHRTFCQLRPHDVDCRPAGGQSSAPAKGTEGQTPPSISYNPHDGEIHSGVPLSLKAAAALRQVA
jgi:hypothetical protein